MPRIRFLALSVLLTLFVSQTLLAKDIFLTIGGGYSPHGNQVSLEKNVFFFKTVLAESYSADVHHDVIFSDGTAKGRDLQFYDPARPLPDVHGLLGRVFQSTKHLQYQYRNHEVRDLYGDSSRANIEKWFNEIGSALTDQDRLFIYITAHGGRGDKKDVHNTGLYLWNSQRINMKDFVAQLDKVPAQVPVVTVMVQCYSGGFADIVFEQGDRTKKIAAHNRCGFFATVHDRPAAGCTPDITEENYHEYSSYFWAAIRGKSRTGEVVESADYNEDGHVALDEAHAFALIHSPTIDISVKTSDAFLRVHSKQKADGKQGLLTAASNVDQLLQRATASERAVLKLLSDQLELVGSDRDSAAKTKAHNISLEKKKLEEQRKKMTTEYSGICKQIAGRLKQQWPEFSNPWHPAIATIVSQEEQQVVAAIRSHPRFKRFDTLQTEINRLNEQIFDLDREWMKCLRARHVLESVALAANLPELAGEEIQQRYQKLILAERQVFGSAQPAAAEKVATTE